ncbi:MAG: hypothetical protein GY874_07940, partial [Desulfobacteraceae bacterium]|nr:hypothetical protein [Desulfobacteraceae bacterium]
ETAASVRKLIWQNRFDEYEIWGELAILSVGWIPQKGPTVKAIIRSAQNKTPFDEVKKVFNRFAKGHLTRYLRSLSATELDEINQQAFKYSNEIFYQIDRQIRKIKGLMTDFSEPLYNELNELIETLRFSGQRHRRMFDRFFNEMHELLDKLLAAAGEHIKVKGAVNSQITCKQIKASWSAIEKLNPPPEKQITVVYQYADKTPVAGAICSIFDQNKSLVAEGPIIDAPETVFQLPGHVNKLTVELHKDPLIQSYIQQPFPNPEVPKAEPGWFDRMTAALDSAGDWTLGVIAGDFNENPTVGQIIANTIITMIPVVDQAGDLRDITACVKLLVWDEKYDQYMVWVGLGLTVVGFVPELGSLVKGILKAVFNKLPIDRIGKVFNTSAKGHVEKYLKELQNGGLKELQKKVVQNTYEILETLQGKLTTLKNQLPEWIGSARDKVISILEALEETKKRVESMFTRFFDELAESLNRALGQNFQLAYEGVPNSTIVSRQAREAPPAHKIEGGGGGANKTSYKSEVEGRGGKVYKNKSEIASKWEVDSTMRAADEAAGVIVNGRYIKNPTAQNLSSLITESGKIGGKRMSGQYMYVVDNTGNIVIGTRAGQRMPHPTLVGGANPQVRAAGIVDIRGGRIHSVNNASGHFKPGASSMNAASESFGKLPSNAFHKDFKGYFLYE